MRHAVFLPLLTLMACTPSPPVTQERYCRGLFPALGPEYRECLAADVKSRGAAYAHCASLAQSLAPNSGPHYEEDVVFDERGVLHTQSVLVENDPITERRTDADRRAALDDCLRQKLAVRLAPPAKAGRP